MKSGAPTVLREYLVGRGLFSMPSNSIDWPLFVGFLPDQGADPSVKLDNAACLYLTQGMVDGKCLRDGTMFEHLPVQMILRSVDVPTAEEKIDAADKMILSIARAQVTVNLVGYVLQSATRRMTWQHLGQDAKNLREVFTGNYILSIKELN